MLSVVSASLLLDGLAMPACWVPAPVIGAGGVYYGLLPGQRAQGQPPSGLQGLAGRCGRG